MAFIIPVREVLDLRSINILYPQMRKYLLEKYYLPTIQELKHETNIALSNVINYILGALESGKIIIPV